MCVLMVFGAHSVSITKKWTNSGRAQIIISPTAHVRPVKKGRFNEREILNGKIIIKVVSQVNRYFSLKLLLVILSALSYAGKKM